MQCVDRFEPLSSNNNKHVIVDECVDVIAAKEKVMAVTTVRGALQ